jgi:hypothetical protein
MTSPRAAALAAHNEGVLLAKAGDFASAASRLRSAIEITGIDGCDPRTLKALWQVAINDGDWKTGIAAGALAAIRDPMDFAFAQGALLSLARCPSSELIPDERFPSLSLPAKLPTLSVILVSEQDARFDSVNAQYERAFAGWPHERIRVKGARSMYDGYARGFAQSGGEIVVFSHDDILFVVPDFAARLASAIENSDMVGVAGTTRISGPALLWAGHPNLHGTITHEADDKTGYDFDVLSLHGPRVTGAQGLDGVFIAGRRGWVERVGFDAERFTGFHFYDVDFSYRAHLAGARITIASDLGLIHRSRGVVDNRWAAAQRAFADKFAFDYEAPGKDRHWYSVRLPNVDAVAAMYAKLFTAWNLRLV